MLSRTADLEYIDRKLEDVTSTIYGMLVTTVEKIGEGPLAEAIRNQLKAAQATRIVLDATPIFKAGD